MVIQASRHAPSSFTSNPQSRPSMNLRVLFPLDHKPLGFRIEEIRAPLAERKRRERRRSNCVTPQQTGCGDEPYVERGLSSSRPLQRPVEAGDIDCPSKL